MILCKPLTTVRFLACNTAAATMMPFISSQTHVTTRLIASGLVAALGVFGIVPSGSARELLDGHWEGAITQPAGDLRIAVDLKTRDDVLSGTFDAPWVAAFRWPLTISSAPPKLSLKIPAGIVFEGELWMKFRPIMRCTHESQQ